jgi:penicillin-binding protein 1B
VRLLQALAQIDAPANPSLLLGAVDLTPLQMAQAYQFLASGGQIQPLRAVRAVLGADGRALNRYDTELDPAQPGDAIAARLVSVALQHAVRHGTGKRLIADGLGDLAPAGKTGTSNDSRDSWFAGYTGSHLAVAWVGNDANEPTGLYGATGAMRVWSGLFERLPSAPLKVSNEGLEWAWVDTERFAVTDEDCPRARRFVFVQGYLPDEYEGCPVARFRDWFGAGDR